MNNREVAETFEKVADMLAIRGDKFHRVMAYRRAAENIRELNRDLNLLMEEGTLTAIPGIGSTLAQKIEEMLTSGRLEFYDRLAKEIPPSLVDLLRVEGLGPKRVRQIYGSLGITNLEQLTQAARDGKLRQLPGMGVKSETRIVAGLEALSRYGDSRTPLGIAWPVANLIVRHLRDLPGVDRVDVAGSLRRMRESIGDIDILVAADDAEPIMEFFCGMENVEKVLGRGPTKSSVLLLNGIQVDLRVLPLSQWGTLLSYFTGSKGHNVRLREMALKQGLSLNEYSFTPQDDEPDILCSSEEAVYATLELPYIPPVLREDKGEIEAAIQGNLPDLVQMEDILGDLHMHSTWSDGKMTIREMAQAAQARGLSHIVIADHSVSLGIANGLSIERLRKQAAEIRTINGEFGPHFTIMQGTEMEIRANGKLDFPDEILAELDFVIASLHVGLRQTQQQIMKRLFAAVHNIHVDMIAHPTGRLIPDRPGADVDMERLIQAAADSGTILEINANPQRLDLQANDVRRAVELGAMVAINTDAHHADHFRFMKFGVATAQRGWATAGDVVNTWTTEKLIAFVRNQSMSKP